MIEVHCVIDFDEIFKERNYLQDQCTYSTGKGACYRA